MPSLDAMHRIAAMLSCTTSPHSFPGGLWLDAVPARCPHAWRERAALCNFQVEVRTPATTCNAVQRSVVLRCTASVLERPCTKTATDTCGIQDCEHTIPKTLGTACALSAAMSDTPPRPWHSCRKAAPVIRLTRWLIRPSNKFPCTPLFKMESSPSFYSGR